MDNRDILLVLVLIFVHKSVAKSQPLSESTLSHSNNQPVTFDKRQSLSSGSHDFDDSTFEAANKAKNECLKTNAIDSKVQCNDKVVVNRKIKCRQGYDCFQRRLIKILDRFDAIKAIPIFGETVTIVKSGENGDQRLESGEDLLPVLVWRIDRYLRAHSIRIRLPEAAVKLLNYMTPAITGEARGRVKKVFFPLALALMITLATLVPMMVSGIALISVKGLWAGLAALLMSSTLAIRALFSPGGSGFAPRLAVVKPQFYPAEVVHHQSDIVTVPAWSRTGSSVPELQYRGYPWTQ